MNLRYFLVGLVICFNAASLVGADGVATIDLYKSEIARFGVSSEIAAPREANGFYASRFFLKDRAVLVTLTAFADAPLTELTKGTTADAGGREIYFEGLRPAVTSICVEVRRLNGDKVSVTHFDLRDNAASETDEFLRFSDVFSLKPSTPWLVGTAGSGEVVVAQLATSNRVVEVTRRTAESLPFQAVVERLTALLAQPRSEEIGPCPRKSNE